MRENDNVPFVVDVGTKGGGSVGYAEIPVRTLRDNLRRATIGLAEALQDIWAVGEFQLAEVTIGLEVSAEGGVHFIGTSKVGGKGTIALKFVAPTASLPST